MEIKIELPGTDFKKLAKLLNEIANEETECFGGKFRRHKIEHGGYHIYAGITEAYDHDEKKLTQNGKVEIKITSINNEQLQD